MTYRFTVLFSILVSLCLVTSAHADPPLTLNAQGLLKSNGGQTAPDGSYGVTVRFYEKAAGGQSV